MNSKKKDSKFNIKNLSSNFEIQKLGLVQVKQFLGIEDVIFGSKVYTTSAQCESQAEVLAISKAEFMKLQSSQLMWSCLTERVSSKVETLKQAIIANR